MKVKYESYEDFARDYEAANIDEAIAYFKGCFEMTVTAGLMGSYGTTPSTYIDPMDEAGLDVDSQRLIESLEKCDGDKKKMANSAIYYVDENQCPEVFFWQKFMNS